MQLIDANAKIVAQLYDSEYEDWVQKEMTVADYLSFSDTAIPFVDAVPVVHGEWIIRNNPSAEWYRVTCSECGEDVTATAPCIGFFPNAKVSWDYCPHCGAKMDLEG